MPRFVLIDHSLKRVGGHHYEYALHVGRAAEAAGFQPVLATHRRFNDGGLIRPSWQLFKPYRQSTYSEHSIVGNLPRWRSQKHAMAARAQGLLPQWLYRQVAGWHDRWSGWRRRRDSNLRIAAFEDGTATLFQWLRLAAGDQVFIPTLNELDLVGLLRYLRAEPSSRSADWHLQFHYDIDLEGDASAAEPYRRQLQSIFSHCHELSASHRLHFYTTTEQLAEQYNRLGPVRFRGLPYPVNPAFQRADGPPNMAAPLVTTCLGGIRDEKGLQFLSGIFDQMWTDYFSTSRLQLVVQAERTGQLPAAVRKRLAQATRDTAVHPPICVAPHPLNSESYVRLVQQSDIGLLMYDRRRYLNRCSGVLVEMLTAGVPVIVPAGCWLADQLAEEIHCHQEGLRDRLPVIQTHRGPLDEVLPPAGATHLLAAFRWAPIDPSTHWARLQVRQIDANGNPLRYEHFIVRQRDGGGPGTALVTLVPGAQRVRLDWQAAYRDASVAVRDVQLDFLSAADEPGGSWPLGAVGLIASEPAQVPTLLRNLVDHYPHYRRTAAEFACRWTQRHSPDRVLAELLSARHLATSAA